MLACIGRDDEAVEIMMRARQLDPGSMIINRDLACVLSWVGKVDEAEQQLKKTIEMDPDFIPAYAHLGRIYTHKGMYDEAFTQYEIVQELDSEWFNLDVMLGYTLAKVGRIDESKKILDKILASIDTQKGKQHEVALIYLGLGNLDKAFEHFEKAIDNREFGAALLGVMLWHEDMRADPRFKELRKKMGLS